MFCNMVQSFSCDTHNLQKSQNNDKKKNYVSIYQRLSVTYVTKDLKVIWHLNRNLVVVIIDVMPICEKTDRQWDWNYFQY